MRPAIDVIVEFIETGMKRKLICYEDGIFANPKAFMPVLLNLVKNNKKITLQHKKLDSFSDAPTDVVFNCAGVKAADFNGREEAKAKYIPTLGHLVLVKDQPTFKDKDVLTINNSMFLIYGPEEKTEHGLKAKESVYVFPKPVIGGTFIEGVALNADGSVKEEQSYKHRFQSIWDNTRAFYGLAPLFGKAIWVNTVVPPVS